jgi:hypothetical protein
MPSLIYILARPPRRPNLRPPPQRPRPPLDLQTLRRRLETRIPPTNDLAPRHVHPHRSWSLRRLFATPLFSRPTCLCILLGRVCASVPITVTYAIEFSTHYPAEVGIIMNFYRSSFGTTTSYFTGPWVEAVGGDEAFGMSAFFVVASFGLVVLLMFKRESIRQIQFTKVSSSEMGTKLRNVDSHGRDLEE